MKKALRFFSLFMIAALLFSGCALRPIDDNTTDSLEESTVNETVFTDAETKAPETTNPETEAQTEAETTTPETTQPVTAPPETEPPVTTPPETQPPVTTPPVTQPPVTTPVTEPVVVTPAAGDCLFIGDSRTEGMRLYSGASADFFSNVGMSINSVSTAKANINGIGEVSLDTLMARKQYKRIFIMLGINEIGSPVTSLIPKYKALLDKIKAAQPNAVIFIEANLHVTNAFTQKSPHINNAAINNYNAELAKLADNSRIFYLDANFLFDDATGQLSSDKSSDGVHYYPKEYKPWVDWLLSQSASLMG